jgi:hypothetical protein
MKVSSRAIDRAVYGYLRSTCGLSATDLSTVGRLLWKGCGGQWTPLNLGVLLYTLGREPRPQNIATYARHIMMSKISGASEVHGFISTAESILQRMSAKIAAESENPNPPSIKRADSPDLFSVLQEKSND